MDGVYRVDGNVAHASPAAGGPWDPKLQHGAAPSSLICWAVERLPSPVPMRVARLTVDLMRPVPVAPLTIETEVIREGRKIQLVGVRLSADGKEVVRATVLRIRKEQRELPSSAFTPLHDVRGPEMGRDPTQGLMAHTPFLSGLSIRIARGSFRLVGPAAIWYRANRPIVDREAISPLMRANIAADFCNGTSNVLEIGRAHV